MKKLIYFVSSYLTLWNIILILLYNNGIISNIHSSSLLLLATYVLVGGLYLHFVKPKYLYIRYLFKDAYKETNNLRLSLIDIIFHIIPIIVLFRYIKINNINLNNDNTLFIFVLLMYDHFNSIKIKYGINYVDCFIIYVITILVYRIFINKYNI
jgi:hypothetical protein